MTIQKIDAFGLGVYIIVNKKKHFFFENQPRNSMCAYDDGDREANNISINRWHSILQLN